MTQPTQIGGPKPPKPPTPEQLFGDWQARPGPETLNPLLKAVQPSVDRALRTYHLQDDPVMRDRARVLVIQNLPKFDPSRAGLNTFVNTSLQRLQREAAPKAVRIPERVHLDAQMLDRTERELDSRLGRTPTVEELADLSGLSVRRIETIRRNYQPSLSEEGFFEQSDGAAGMAPGTERSEHEDLWLGFFYADLDDPIDKKIFEWSTGWGGAPRLTKTEMARRLGRSVPAISQRSDRLAGELEELMRAGGQVL